MKPIQRLFRLNLRGERQANDGERQLAFLINVFTSGLLIGLTSSVAGCGRMTAREMSVAELEQVVNGPTGRFSTMWQGTYYCGTAGGYHYFRHRVKSRSDMLIKIEATALAIHPTREYSQDESMWVEISSLLGTPSIQDRQHGVLDRFGERP